MEIAGKLIEKGINFPKIVDETFFTKTYNQNRIAYGSRMAGIRK